MLAANQDVSTNTIESCLAYCDAGGFPLAGLEYGSQCFCGNYLSNGASLSLPATCAMPCAGNSKEICGGYYAMSLFVSTKANAAGLTSDLTANPTAITLPSGWAIATASCINEASGRALTGASYASDNMTVANCLNFCASGGFQYGGVEYGRECYCGSSLVNGASFTSTSTNCGMPCSGDGTESCGGYYALQMYSNANYAYSNVVSNGFVKTACIQEVANRALRGASFTDPAMTTSKCTAYCSARGFQYAGLEYADECYCGSQLVGGASLSLVSDQCYMPCAGDSTDKCGGPNGLMVYISPTVPVATVSLPTGWTTKGCYAEANGARALTYEATSLFKSGTMTNIACALQCQTLGYSYSGTEYSSQCFCGNGIANSASIKAADSSNCNFACSGNSAEMCGGNWFLTVTSLGSSVIAI